MAFELIPILFGAIIGLVHFFSSQIHTNPKHRIRSISFTAGIFITYLFLEMFPFFFESHIFLTRVSLLSVLGGFVIFHILEKHAYKHRSVKKSKKELRQEHSASIFIYHFFIGILLVSISSLDILKGLLFFIPILLLTAISSISLREVHEIEKTTKIKFAISISTLLGVLTASLMPITQLIFHALIGFVTGTLLYIIVMDSMPKEKKGKPEYFLLGAVFYIILIAIKWMI